MNSESSIRPIVILLIEDNPGDARLVLEMLKDFTLKACKLVVKPTLYEGIEYLSTSGADLVLLDLTLPDSHGYETFLKLQENSHYTPIIILSGLDDEELASKAVKAGGQDYLVKDLVDSRQLEKAIMYSLERTILLRQMQNELKERDDSLSEILKKESKLQMMLDSLPLPVFEIDNTYRIVYANFTAFEMFGYTKTDMEAGVQILQLVAVSDRARGQQNIQKVFKGIRTTGHEYQGLRKNGSSFPILLYTSPVLHNETVVGVRGIVVDISERKRAEGVLHLNEVKYRNLFSFAPVGIYQTTRDGRFITVNSKLVEILGYDSREELMSKNIGRDIFASSADRERLIAAYADASVGNEEIQWQRKDGSYIWVELTMHLIKDNGGNLEYLEGFVWDRTERRKADEQIARLSYAVEQSSVCVVVVDLDGNIEYVNSRFSQLTGYSAEEVLGKNPRILKSGLNAASIYQDLWETISSGKIWKGKLINRKKNGELYWELLTISPIISKDDKVVSYIAIKENITEQIKMQNELVENQKLFSTVLEIMPVGVWLIDGKGMFKHGNSAVRKIWGGAKMVGPEDYHEYKAWWPSTGKLIEPDERPELKALRKGEATLDVEMEIENFSGERKTILCSAVPMQNSQKEITGVLVLNHDITSNKLWESQLISAKENAEVMNRLKSSFLTNMSHELRTPMIGILGFTEILEEEIEDPNLKEKVHAVHTSAAYLMETLNLILDLSRLEAKRVELTFEPVNVTKLVHEVVDACREKAIQKTLEMSLSISPPLITINTDERLLRQILINLVGNAVKYTEKGGVAVAVEQQVSETRKVLYIQVADTGIGISNESQKIIWDEFRQVSEGFKRSYDGTGLGLTITRKFVEKLHGTISLKSELGKGTEFTVTLPFGLEKQEAAE